MSSDGAPSLYHLPPEILEQIFNHFTADLPQLRAIAHTCRKFRAVVSQVAVGTATCFKAYGNFFFILILVPTYFAIFLSAIIRIYLL